ncbi:MAG: ABC transporter permease [Deltaproteobacteria bacterium]|nr:ABC transporter permease [Deltaproteobacteria bacterium]
MIRLALRNLARNRWRSGLTLGGVAVAVAMLIWSDGLMEAFLVTMTESATAMQLGDLRIESEAHAHDSSVYNAFTASPALLESVRRVPGVRTVAPRLLTFGLLGHKTRSQGALVLGVDPAIEAQASDVAKSVVAGTWLSPRVTAGERERQVVLGQDLASLLAVKVGDDLVVMLQAADGTMGDDRLRLVGIARTGTSDLDRQAAWMRLGDVAYLAALEGQAHELVVRSERGVALDHVATGIRAVIAAGAGPKLVARTWKQLVPDLHQMIELSRNSMIVLYAIVYFIAALGILNAQRMSALERKREFAVMMSVGVTPARLGTLVIVESVLLASMGAVLGALLGWGLSAYHAHAGLDLAALGSQGFTFAGISFHSRIYFVLRPGMVVLPAVAVLGVGALCGLWPALASSRIKLASTISGRL